MVTKNALSGLQLCFGWLGEKEMRVSLGALMALPFTVATVLAADLPAPKALYVPPPVPPAASPFYVGLFGGGVFGGSGTNFGGKNLFCLQPCPAVAGPPNGGTLGSAPRAGNSPFGGIRIGADFAVSRSVFLGGVADISVMNRKVSSRFAYSNFGPESGFGSDRGVLASSLESNWIGTLRAKIGLGVTDRVVLFGTGGLAFVDVRASTRTEYDVFGVSSERVGPGLVQQGAVSGVALGYAFGGGVEYQFTRHLSASLEYLHYSASKNYVVRQTSGTALTAPFIVKARPSGHLVRVGLDYRL